LMAPDVASRAPDPCGVWMYTGQDYDGNAHRVAVPVPDAGNERASVEAARRYLANNRAPSTAGNRPFWELSGGILFCGCCGRRMVTHTPHSGRTKTGNSYSYHRYRCVGDTDLDKGRCEVRPRVPAEKTEEAVWDLVSSLASDSGLMVSRLDRLIEAERLRLRGDPKAEEEKMRERLADLDRRADNLHNAVIDALEEGGILQRERFEQRLRAIEERREATERELEAWGRRGERMHALEAMRDAYSGELMRDAFADHPDAPVNEIQERFMERVRVTRKEKVLDQYTPEQRHQLYREHEVRVEAKSKDELEVSGVFGSELLYIGAGSSSGRCTPRMHPRRSTGS
ncbi:MAG TPA: zinc ribbon domain-containing protein, partial [Rubrobacter sp.]|nr:zinc ribbon domain-containing protein [Rubrobacter sp.]